METGIKDIKKWNILFLWTAPFRKGGGVGSVSETLAAEFKRKGHYVSYLSLSKGEDYIHDGIRQYFSSSRNVPSLKENIDFLFSFIYSNKTDIIINQSGITDNQFLKQLQLKKPEHLKILSVHHNCIRCLQESYQRIMTESYGKNPLFPLVNHDLGFKLLRHLNRIKYGKMFRDCIDYSDRLVLLSDHFIPELKVYLTDFPQEKVMAIHNPAPFETNGSFEHQKENRLVYVGRIEYNQKQANLLLDIWRKLHATFPDWHFDIVGDGSKKKELEMIAKKEGLPRIQFHGYQDPRPFLEKAKFCLMTSSFEGFGMVLVEAQAYGVVPFAFNCFSAIEEIIEHEASGFLVPPFDLDQYVEQLMEVMQNENKRKEMANCGRQMVNKFRAEEIVGSWLNEFSKLTNKKVFV